MRLTQSNKLSMLINVSSYLKMNEEIVNTAAQFVSAVSKFETLLNSIIKKEEERQNSTPGKTEIKYSAEDNLVEKTVKIASGLFIYARRNNKAEIKALSDVTEKSLARLKDSDLIVKCTQINEAAQTVIAELAGFGVEAADITEHKSMIEIYENSIGRRDASVSTRIGAGSSIHELFKEADALLEEELDKFVDPFKSVNHEFYNGYYAARNIKNIGVRHEKKEEETTSEAQNI